MATEGAASSVGGVLALDLDGVLFVSPEPAGVAGEYADRRRVRVKVPHMRDVWGMRVSEPVWVSPAMIADVNALIGLPGVRLVLVSSWGAASRRPSFCCREYGARVTRVVLCAASRVYGVA